MNTLQVDILLVEDSPSDAELTIRALKKRNLSNHLLHVSDGQEALDFLFCTGTYAGRPVDAQPRVIMLDLKLPKVNGIEVLRQIRANERTKLLPVVIMTSSREDCDVIDCYTLGANSFVVKPVDFESFAEAVGNLGVYWVMVNQPPVCSHE